MYTLYRDMSDTQKAEVAKYGATVEQLKEVLIEKKNRGICLQSAVNAMMRQYNDLLEYGEDHDAAQLMNRITFTLDNYCAA